MTDKEKIPTAMSESIMEIAGHELRVYVLDNGQRIINADDLLNFFGVDDLSELLPIPSNRE